MIDKIVSYIMVLFAGVMGLLFFMKKKSLENSAEENKIIQDIQVEVTNEAKKLSDNDLDNAITDKLKNKS